MDCRGRTVPLGERTLIMGILNITPDSFSDGGKYMDCRAAVDRAKQMVAEGADIIDLGGESTRPGYQPVSEPDELDRILPVLRALLTEVPAPVSVDTAKAVVAKEALFAGAHMLNDQWALRRDPELAGLAAAYRVPLILMHNQSRTEYRDLIGDIIAYFREGLQIAFNAGVESDKIIIDPGFGFGKKVEQNLELLRRLKELKCLKLPIMVGTSRKSTIGKVLDLPVEQRLEGTASTVAVSIMNGAAIIRVHDVREMTRVARMTDAIMRGWGGSSCG